MPSSLPPTKKRKTTKNSGLASTTQRLENQLIDAVSSHTSLNPLVDLLKLVDDAEDARDVSKGMYAAYRVFVVILRSGKYGLEGQVEEEGKVVRAWMWERLGGYVDYLICLLKDNEKALRVSSLQILFSLQKHLSTLFSASGAKPQFHVSHFKKIVSGLLICPPSRRKGASRDSDGKLDADVREVFVQTWFSVHDDVRWFFLREAVPILAANGGNPEVPANLLSVLESLMTFPTDPAKINAWWVEELGSKPSKQKSSKDADEEQSDEANSVDDIDDWRKFFDDQDKPSTPSSVTPKARLHKLSTHQSLHSLASHRAVFTRIWLALLPRLEMDRELSVRALNVMHRGVLPHLTRPVLVMDWVGACVDFGGTVGLLALNALFVLMREYNLDYPSFYTRLYSFLDRDVLHLKHRARFFRMTELFLSSTHLPATLLASFIKRLSRLSLNAPPAAIVMIIPFTYNILKRHPALMGMIHRLPGEDTAEMDPFVMDEPNPNLTNALDSSLWELHSHKRHYHSAVSTLVKILEEAFTKQSYAMEDFLDHTYGTMFETEVNRRVKREPAVETDIRNGLFKGGGCVSELWTWADC